MIWLVPGVVFLLGAVLVIISGLRAAEEAKRLVWQLRLLGTLRPALADASTAAQRLRASLREKSRT